MKVRSIIKDIIQNRLFLTQNFFSYFELSCLDIRFAHLRNKSKKFKYFMSLKHSTKNQIINIVILCIFLFSFENCTSFDAIIWPVRPVRSMSACTRRILRIDACSCLATTLYRQQCALPARKFFHKFQPLFPQPFPNQNISKEHWRRFYFHSPTS